MSAIVDEDAVYSLKETKLRLHTYDSEWLDHFTTLDVTASDFDEALAKRQSQRKQQARLRAAVRTVKRKHVMVQDMLPALWHRCKTWPQFIRDVERMLEMLVDQHHVELLQTILPAESLEQYDAKKDVMMEAAKVVLPGTSDTWVGVFSARLFNQEYISIGDFVRVSTYSHGLFEQDILKTYVRQLLVLADQLIAAGATATRANDKYLPLGIWKKNIDAHKAAREQGIGALLDDMPRKKGKTASQTASDDDSDGRRTPDSSVHSGDSLPDLLAYSDSDDSDDDVKSPSTKPGGSELELGGPGLGAPAVDAAGLQHTSTPPRQQGRAAAGADTNKTPMSQEATRKRRTTSSPLSPREVAHSKGGSKGGPAARATSVSAVHLLGSQAVGVENTHEESDSDGTARSIGQSRLSPVMFMEGEDVWIDSFPLRVVDVVLQNMRESTIEWLIADSTHGMADALSIDEECSHLVALPVVTNMLQRFGRSTRELVALVTLSAHYLRDVLAAKVDEIHAFVRKRSFLYMEGGKCTEFLIGMVRNTATDAAMAMIAASGADASASADALPSEPALKSRTHSSGGGSQKGAHGVVHGKGGSEQAVLHMPPAPAPKAKVARKRSISPVQNLRVTAAGAGADGAVQHGKGSREKAARHLSPAPALEGQLAHQSNVAAVHNLHVAVNPERRQGGADGAAQHGTGSTERAAQQLPPAPALEGQLAHQSIVAPVQNLHVAVNPEQTEVGPSWAARVNEAAAAQHAVARGVTEAAVQTQVGGVLQPDGSVVYNFSSWVPYDHTGAVPVVKFRRRGQGATREDPSDRKWYKLALPTSMFPESRDQWGSQVAREWLRLVVTYGINHRVLESESCRSVSSDSRPEPWISQFLPLLPVELQDRLTAAGHKVAPHRAMLMHSFINKGAPLGHVADYLTPDEVAAIIITPSEQEAKRVARRELLVLRYNPKKSWDTNSIQLLDLFRVLELSDKSKYNAVYAWLSEPSSASFKRELFGRQHAHQFAIELPADMSASDATVQWDRLVGEATAIMTLREEQSRKDKEAAAKKQANSVSVVHQHAASTGAPQGTHKPSQQQQHTGGQHAAVAPRAKLVLAGEGVVTCVQQLLEKNPSLPRRSGPLLPTWAKHLFVQDARCYNCFGEYHGQIVKCDASHAERLAAHRQIIKARTGTSKQGPSQLLQAAPAVQAVMPAHVPAQAMQGGRGTGHGRVHFSGRGSHNSGRGGRGRGRGR